MRIPSVHTQDDDSAGRFAKPKPAKVAIAAAISLIRNTRPVESTPGLPVPIIPAIVADPIILPG